jgi:hypothetical protein
MDERRGYSERDVWVAHQRSPEQDEVCDWADRVKWRFGQSGWCELRVGLLGSGGLVRAAFLGLSKEGCHGVLLRCLSWNSLRSL